MSVGVVSADPDGCPVSHYGYAGRVVCGYDMRSYDWGDLNVEWFVVGTDFSIWHIWKGSGGWHSLGGLASAFPPNGAYIWFNANGLGVWTIGTDGWPWCRAWPWTGWWQRCSTIQPPPVLQH